MIKNRTRFVMFVLINVYMVIEKQWLLTTPDTGGAKPVGRDLKPYVVYTILKTDDENTIFLSLGVIPKVQVLKKASPSLILVDKACAYSKPLVTIEAPLHVQLQLLVTAYLSIKN